jgi:hypothetical protein
VSPVPAQTWQRWFSGALITEGGARWFQPPHSSDAVRQPRVAASCAALRGANCAPNNLHCLCAETLHICAETLPHLRRDSATSAPRLCHICAETLPHLSKTCHICLRLATSAPGGTYHHLRWGCPAAVRGRARPHPRRDLLPGVASDRPSLFRGTPKRHDEAVRPWHHAVLDRLRTPLCSALLSPLK